MYINNFEKYFSIIEFLKNYQIYIPYEINDKIKIKLIFNIYNIWISKISNVLRKYKKYLKINIFR